jgi:enamine deaminase RidA (YjgF/YER057c/UK114 family)
MSFADVVSARVYIVDPSSTDEMYGIYRGYFSGEPPPPTTATALLTSADYLVEITMTASKGRTVTRPVVIP